MASLLLMITSVVLFSLYALLATIGLKGNDPVLFVAVAHLAAGLVAFGWAATRLPKKKKKLFELPAKVWGLIAITATAGAINHMCFMFALLKTSPAGATIIYETWPILTAWLAPLLIEKGWEQLRRMDYVFGLLAVAGVAFIVAGENRGMLSAIDFTLLQNIDPVRLEGYGLALIGSLGVAISTGLRRRVSRSLMEKYNGDRLLGVLLGSGFTRLATLPVFAIGYWASHVDGGLTLTSQGLGLAAVTGVGVYLMGSLCYLFSVMRNPNPSIPVPDFIAPVLAVAWLWIFANAGLTDIAVVGGLFVISANLLVTVRAEEGCAYTASILTILLGGAWCYFTRGAPMDDYYDALSLTAVFYAIQVAFAWDRVLDRAKREEALELDIAYAIEGLRHGKTKHSTLKRLVAAAHAVFSTTDRIAMGITYRELVAVRKELGEDEKTSKLYHDIDTLILSKTKDILLSEVVLLCLIGGITFIGILAYRPSGLWPDMMAFIMGGAIVFIFFALFDQQAARNTKMLQAEAEGESLCHISDESFECRHEFKMVTIALLAVMLAIFFGLFRYKYGFT
ncbi:MAG: DMT family transporter [Alphaproteobacteria bacterium]